VWQNFENVGSTIIEQNVTNDVNYNIVASPFTVDIALVRAALG